MGTTQAFLNAGGTEPPVRDLLTRDVIGVKKNWRKTCIYSMGITYCNVLDSNHWMEHTITGVPLLKHTSVYTGKVLLYNEVNVQSPSLNQS